ncbi:MAG: hypothetical protein WD042_16155 [Phycisphaeraceae bacterium]
MSVLTKVFVVLVTVLSIAFVAMTVVFVANTENFREQAVSLKEELSGAQKTNHILQGDLAAASAEKAKTLADLNAELEGLTSALNKQVGDTAGLQQALDAKNREFAALSADLTGVKVAMQQNVQILDATLAELKQKRDDLVKAQTDAIQVRNRNDELDSTVKALENQVRYMKEQLAMSQEEIARLEGLVAQGGAGAQETTSPLPDVRIEGKITRVQDVSGKTFVQISVGRADRVLPRMKFLISRDGKFMGNLIIQSVDERASAGVVELPQGAIQEGDLVMTAPL